MDNHGKFPQANDNVIIDADKYHPRLGADEPTTVLLGDNKVGRITFQSGGKKRLRSTDHGISFVSHGLGKETLLKASPVQTETYEIELPKENEDPNWTNQEIYSMRCNRTTSDPFYSLYNGITVGVQRRRSTAQLLDSGDVMSWNLNVFDTSGGQIEYKGGQDRYFEFKQGGFFTVIFNTTIAYPQTAGGTTPYVARFAIQTDTGSGFLDTPCRSDMYIPILNDMEGDQQYGAICWVDKLTIPAGALVRVLVAWFGNNDSPSTSKASTPESGYRNEITFLGYTRT